MQLARRLMGLFFLLDCSFVVQASECVKTVRWNDDPPYNLRTADGDMSGITIDLVREALLRINCTAQFVEMPWARGLLSLQKGRLDILPGALRNKEREAFAYFSLPVNRSPNVLFVGKTAANKRPINQLSDLIGSDFRLGAQIGVTYSEAYQTLMQQPDFAAHVVLINHRRAAWRMIEAGRLDGLIADEITGLMELEQLGLSEVITRNGLIVSGDAAGFALSKTSLSEDFVSRFDLALQSMFADGSYQRIMQNYLPCEVSVERLGCVQP
ncbi:MAG: transporter substrate-binding domain-containing protein [Pseudomonas sp.]|nr:transporter substrate-binding domain-containing protein [Pseudomonas sp.]